MTTEYEIYSRNGYRFTVTDVEDAFEEIDNMDDGYIVAVVHGVRSRLTIK